jgi:hypothetical protein
VPHFDFLIVGFDDELFVEVVLDCIAENQQISVYFFQFYSVKLVFVLRPVLFAFFSLLLFDLPGVVLNAV